MPIPDPPTYDHGSTGTKPTSAIDYANGDSLDAENLDYYLNTQFTKLDQIITALREIRDGVITVTDAQNAVDADNVTGTYKGNDIDSDGDGTVNSADTADDATNVTSTYKGNDLDSDADGRVNAADHAANATNVTATYKGNDIDSDGDGRVDAADDATTLKGNDIDSDGDGRVDEADFAADATTLKGNDIDSDGDGKVNSANVADSAKTLKGNDIDTNGDGRVDVADNTLTVKGNDIDADGDGQVDAADTADTVVADGPFNGIATANALLTRVHTVSEGGTVPNGDAFNIWTTHLNNGETLSVVRYAFLSADGTAVPSGVDLAIATLDGNGGFTRQTQIQSGGTVTYDATGSLSAPQATYTAPSNGPVAVVVDNASGSKADVLTELTVITE